MAKVKLKSVSHRFEADMIKELLKEAHIEVDISDHNGSENMDVYLGYEPNGVEIFVAEEQLEEATAILESTTEIEDVGAPVKMMKFPYWIIIGFALMLLIFILYNL